ncbi:hydroxymethylbilane synthase [Cyclobacterium lianum]|uniref:Porphobilinogen deaminase n=1 Tax=Cyclobacterium lianum TaxID=388280 RepID=A0A1M7NHR9_9BACT|nr:hydroxymethylbilane synthase [Cyclobacterium lianum]SHN03396.1 hydroxymethylbilane synthase [Cyclobacterium lianum]
MKPIRIGTRGSKLALFQAHHVANLLEQKGISSEIVVIETKGDQVLDVAISKIGSKGVFTEELENRLAEGLVDIAVHSAKDLPSRLPDGFEVIAFTEREKVNDVIISHHDKLPDLAAQKVPLVLGTSSTRRIATLKHFYPNVKTTDIRGNLQTRIAKMENGVCDGLLLAYAGVHRMGYDHLIRKELNLQQFIPAVGQGSIGIEACHHLAPDTRKAIIDAVNHPATAICLRAERSFLKILEGGCSIPAFALAQWQGEQVELKGGLMSLDGKNRLYDSFTGTENEAKKLGNRLAESILSRGGAQILKEIKNKLNE